jgi:hypothetical protein
VTKIFAATFYILLLTVSVSDVAGQTSPKPLSQDQIVQLLRGAVTPARVAELARQRGIDFAVTPEIEQRLRKLGATDSLMARLKESAPKPVATVPVPGAPGFVPPPQPTPTITPQGTASPQATQSTLSKPSNFESQQFPPQTSGLLGVQVKDLTEDVRQRFYKYFSAVVVSGVATGTPADAAGIRAGDLIQSIVLSGENPVGVSSEAEFRLAAERCTPDCLVRLFHLVGEKYAPEKSFIPIGSIGTNFAPVYGHTSKVVLAYRDIRSQRTYAGADFSKISEEDGRILVSEAQGGLIAGTVGTANGKAEPITITTSKKSAAGTTQPPGSNKVDLSPTAGLQVSSQSQSTPPAAYATQPLAIPREAQTAQALNSNAVTELVHKLSGYWQGKKSWDSNYVPPNDAGKPYHAEAKLGLLIQPLNPIAGTLTAKWTDYMTLTDRLGMFGSTHTWTRDFRAELEVTAMPDGSIATRILSADVRMNRGKYRKLTDAIVRKLEFQGLNQEVLHLDIAYDPDQDTAAELTKY